jgi:hypothetical protein
MIRARLGSKAWKMTAAPRRTPKQGKSSTMKTKAVASNRLVASFKYVGEPNLEMLPLVVE